MAGVSPAPAHPSSCSVLGLSSHERYRGVQRTLKISQDQYSKAQHSKVSVPPRIELVDIRRSPLSPRCHVAVERGEERHSLDDIRRVDRAALRGFAAGVLFLFEPRSRNLSEKEVQCPTHDLRKVREHERWDELSLSASLAAAGNRVLQRSPTGDAADRECGRRGFDVVGLDVVGLGSGSRLRVVLHLAGRRWRRPYPPTLRRRRRRPHELQRQAEWSVNSPY